MPGYFSVFRLYDSIDLYNKHSVAEAQPNRLQQDKNPEFSSNGGNSYNPDFLDLFGSNSTSATLKDPFVSYIKHFDV